MVEDKGERVNVCDQLRKAFPTSISVEADLVLSEIDLNSRLDPAGSFFADVRGETLEIPYRIYLRDGNLLMENRFSQLGKEILFCLYTRHHDGFVRERCVKGIIDSSNLWTAPYVIRLVGEYVVEILDAVKRSLPEVDRKMYREFLLANSGFYETTRCRVISYWDCYYRLQYPRREDYVGFQLLEFFDALRK